MRAKWIQGLILAITAVVVSGCRAGTPELKPPEGPEEYVLPPQSDRRYSEHARYPKDVLYEPPKKQNDISTGPPTGPGMGMRPGIGGSGLR